MYIWIVPTVVAAAFAAAFFFQRRKIKKLEANINQNTEANLLRETAEGERALAYLQTGSRGIPLTLNLLAPGLSFGVRSVLVGDANTLYLQVVCAEVGMWEGDRFLCVQRSQLVLDRNPEEKNPRLRYIPFGHAPNCHDTLTVTDVMGVMHLAVTVGTVTRPPTGPLMRVVSKAGESAAAAA